MNKFPELKTLPTEEEIDELKQRNAELESQLVEVNNNRTGVAPCARFCEALAAKKMFDNLQRENAELMAQVERLQGTKPKLPPFPPQGRGLPRYGIRWNGQYEPISVPMDDGYWTPWHLAAEHDREVVARAVEAALNLYARAVYRADELPFKQAEYVIDSAAAFAEQYANKIKSGEVEV